MAPWKYLCISWSQFCKAWPLQRYFIPYWLYCVKMYSTLKYIHEIFSSRKVKGISYAVIFFPILKISRPASSRLIVWKTLLYLPDLEKYKIASPCVFNHTCKELIGTICFFRTELSLVNHLVGISLSLLTFLKQILI